MKTIFSMMLVLVFMPCLHAGYFAELNQNNTVKRVIVADSTLWCEKYLGGIWIETFIDSPNKNYAGKGHDYYVIYNDFVAPTPFLSWVLNEKRRWEAPKIMTNDGKKYNWNESIINWEKVVNN